MPRGWVNHGGGFIERCLNGPVLEEAQRFVSPDANQSLHRQRLQRPQRLKDASDPAAHLSRRVDVVRLRVLSEALLYKHTRESWIQSSHNVHHVTGSEMHSTSLSILYRFTSCTTSQNNEVERFSLAVLSTRRNFKSLKKQRDKTLKESLYLKQWY